MNRELTCIICPRGCGMKVELEGESISVQGNACKRGEAYAIAECTNPTRTLTTIVRVANRTDTMVSVKTKSPIAKDRLFEAMEKIRTISVNAPIMIGDVILEDICGSELIATKQIL